MLKWIAPSLALVALPAIVSAVEPAPTQAPAPAKREISPEADRLLHQMTDYLAGLHSFKMQSSSTDEVVTTAGQKIQVATQSMVSVQRPNQLYSEQVGTENALSFWYDGKTMSLYCKANNSYATLPAPPTIDGTIDEARKQFKIEAPGADLFYSHPYDILTEQVTGGQVIGKETIGGMPANHLAFTGEEVDWQVWIQDGPKPLPLRYVITTKTMKEQPQFTVELSKWETDAKMSDSVFAFHPPAGATRVSSFPTVCRAGH
jgi:hypothetical protein